MISWEEFKKEKYRRYEEAKRKGEIDREIIPLLELINSKREFATLSSCSGRIAVIDTPEFGDKLNSKFLGKWHRTVDVDEILCCADEWNETTWLVVDPPILHIACENLDAARYLMNAANNAGFKRCGLISLKKIVVEITSNDRLEMLLAVNGEKILKSKGVEIVAAFANSKLLKGREKLRRFEDLMRRINI